MAKRKGVCWMCGRAGPLTEEHAFPDWIRQIFARDGNDIALSDHRAGVTERSLTWTNTSGEVVVRSVCGACNQGWMSALEGRCKPVLGPLIHGHRARLEPDAQAVLALWAVKTAWAFQSTNPATSTCTADQRHALATEHAVPNGMRVLLGGYDEAGGRVLCFSWYTAGSTRAGVGRLDASATTLVIGRVVLQVLQLTASDGPSETPVQQPWPATVALRRLLPSTGEPIDWPSLPPLRHGDLDGFVKPPVFTPRHWANLPPLSAPPTPKPPPATEPTDTSADPGFDNRQ